jgi:cobyrinic acid a,c-diamide synthase
MIAAPASGSGKSVIASGLMAAFSSQFAVQGFKVGPDYIDPMYHTAATGRASRNLDAWILSAEKVQDIFIRASEGASISIIEGVMGLFDGYGSDPFQGSSANIATLLKIPIILVLDCSKMSGSAAAVIHGFHTFSSSLRLDGVICNRVGSQRHGQWLKETIEKHNSIPVLGCIPRLPALQIPERHLGLFTVPERSEAVQDFIHQAALILAQYVDLDHLIKIARTADQLHAFSTRHTEIPSPTVRLAVARDEAFCFYYEDNLDELRRSGAEIVPFSPLTDERLPEAIGGIYFGGGYPELYADRLSQNNSMRSQVLANCEQNMPIYAECGGLMYLTEGIHLLAGDYPLVGALPGWCEMSNRLSMGYREVETLTSGLLGAVGQTLRGHEFHYSHWENPSTPHSTFRICPRTDGGKSRLDGYATSSLQASYIHLHFSQYSSLAENFVRACRDWHAATTCDLVSSNGGFCE